MRTVELDVVDRTAHAQDECHQLGIVNPVNRFFGRRFERRIWLVFAGGGEWQWSRRTSSAVHVFSNKHTNSMYPEANESYCYQSLSTSLLSITITIIRRNS